MPSDIRTRAIVLRRTNYGESDRILNLITPEGKVAVLARGVRKSKSRLAGGIELFSVADVVIHQGRSTLSTLTSAKMLSFYSNLLADVSKLELAGTLLKRLDRASEQVPSPEHFTILQQSLEALNDDYSNELVFAWFALNLARSNGEEINFLRDTSGTELSPDLSYNWDTVENALRPDSHGKVDAKAIKLARFLLSHPLRFASKIEHLSTVLPPIYEIAKIVHNQYWHYWKSMLQCK